jgi:serine/threonine protein kinase
VPDRLRGARVDGDLTSAALSREMLSTHEIRVLSAGGAGNPDVTLVEHDGTRYVLKDFAARSGWIRLVAPFLIRRELRAYRQLRDHAAVPGLVAQLDPLAFVLEYRPGEVLGPGLAAWVPGTFIADLRDAIADMHARGVVHLDLRHRSNALADPDGRPVLIDFASSLCFRPGGLAARLLLPLFAWIDTRAVVKWERQLLDAGFRPAESGR